MTKQKSSLTVYRRTVNVGCPTAAVAAFAGGAAAAGRGHLVVAGLLIFGGMSMLFMGVCSSILLRKADAESRRPPLL